MTQAEAKESKRLLRAPWSVLLLIGLLLGVHVLYFVSNDLVRNWLIVMGAFAPARLFGEVSLMVPAMPYNGMWTLLTHAFLHGSWEHVIINSLWLLIFGTPVARRLGAIRFYLFFFLGVLLAVLFYSLFALRSEYVLGASGGVAALLGASVRFAFGVQGEFYRPDAPPQPLLSLRAVLRNRTALTFILIWLAVDGLFALWGMSFTGEAIRVAWGAHLGGFIAGFLLIWVLDRPIYSPSGGPGQSQYGAWAGSNPDTGERD